MGLVDALLLAVIIGGIWSLAFLWGMAYGRHRTLSFLQDFAPRLYNGVISAYKARELREKNTRQDYEIQRSRDQYTHFTDDELAAAERAWRHEESERERRTVRNQRP